MPKKRAKKLYRTILGIPIWMISAIAIYFIISIGYDAVVGDMSMRRTILLILATFLLFLTLGLHLVSIKYIIRIAKGQIS